MEENRPKIVMIAGPNGAGKTTLAFSLLPDFFKLYDFLNPDEIARGISPLEPSRGNRKAGEILLQRIDDYIQEKRSFAFETTASGLAHIQRLRRAKEQGYIIHLIYLFVLSPEVCLSRIKHRVQQGGHDVLSEDVIRRYHRGARNILEYYEPCADISQLYVSENFAKKTFAKRMEGSEMEILDPRIWEAFLKTGKSDEQA